MFTGIITDIGTVIACERSTHDTQLHIRTRYDTATIALGASIACNGICLTVTQLGDDWFAVLASAETARVTNLNQWQTGSSINLERALRIGDELGGHFVSGHVDGTAPIESITPVGESHQLVIRVPDALQYFIAPKGSVTLDGIALTVNDVSDNRITLNIIPHSWEHTNLSQRKPGDALNLEIDPLARITARLLESHA